MTALQHSFSCLLSPYYHPHSFIHSFIPLIPAQSFACLSFAALLCARLVPCQLCDQVRNSHTERRWRCCGTTVETGPSLEPLKSQRQSPTPPKSASSSFLSPPPPSGTVREHWSHDISIGLSNPSRRVQCHRPDGALWFALARLHWRRKEGLHNSRVPVRFRRKSLTSRLCNYSNKNNPSARHSRQPLHNSP